MDKHNQNKQISSDAEQQKNRRLLLLVLLLLLALFSSVIVGFLIGRNAEPYRGQIIDTIVLGSDQNRGIHITGQVRYTNGTPFQNGMVELRSEPRVTVTDSRGSFFYNTVEPGKHTLSVLDTAGEALAKCDINVSRNTGGRPLNIEKQADGKYAVWLSVNVRLIELAVELDADSKTLELIPEKVWVFDDKGILTQGDKQMDVSDGAIVLPSGTVLLTDKTAIVPGHIILSDNSVTAIPESGYTGTGGEKISSDGTIKLPDGTEITPEGVKKPDGSILNPDEAYQITGNASENAKPSGSTNQTDVTVKSDSSDSMSRGEESSQNGVTLSPTTTEPVDDGRLSVQGQNSAGWQTWESHNTIDLFFNRTGTADNGKIQPGSKGYYLFKLENNRAAFLNYTIKLREMSFHLPLRMRLIDENGNATAWRTLTAGQPLQLVTGNIGNTAVTYRLEWEWPYDSGDNRADTEAATGNDQQYLVNLEIHAE